MFAALALAASAAAAPAFNKVAEDQVSIKCAASGCLVPANATDHGCRVVSGNEQQCWWDGVAAAEAGCGGWGACKAFVCVTATSGRFPNMCLARGTADVVPFEHDATEVWEVYTKATEAAPAPSFTEIKKENYGIRCGQSGPNECLVPAENATQHGCNIITPVKECWWNGVEAAKAGCGGWDECKAFMCVTAASGKFPNMCLARGNADVVPFPHDAAEVWVMYTKDM